MINHNSNNFYNDDKKCEHLSANELIYHSSEQYLILCLKICNLIIKNKCNVRDLVDFDRYMDIESPITPTTIQTTKFKLDSTSNDTNKSLSLRNTTSLINKLTSDYIRTNLTSTKSSFVDLDLKTTSSLTYPIPSTFIPAHHYSSSYSPLLLSNLNETECMKYGHRESYKLSLFIFGIILCLIILVLNSLTLITIIKSKRLHSITNILIANLSLSDFLSGVAFLYPCILNLLTINALETYNSYLYTIACNIRNYYYLCLAGYSPMITSMLNSMFSLTLLAFEKYIAILHPYMYERLIQDRKYLCYLCLLLTWTISILVSLLPIMGWNEANKKYSSYRGFDCKHAQSLPCMFERIFTLDYILLFTSICCVCVITMLAIYIKIYLIARKHSKKIAKMKSILNMNNQMQYQDNQVEQLKELDGSNADQISSIDKNNNEYELVIINLGKTKDKENDNNYCGHKNGTILKSLSLLKSFSSNSIHSLSFTLNSYERSEKILNTTDANKENNNVDDENDEEYVGAEKLESNTELDDTELEDNNQITITSVSSISYFKNLKYKKYNNQIKQNNNDKLLVKKMSLVSSANKLSTEQDARVKSLIFNNKFKMFDKNKKKKSKTNNINNKTLKRNSSRTVSISQTRTNLFEKDIIKAGTTTTNQANRNMSRCGSGSGDISGYAVASTTKNLNKSMKAMKTLLILLMGFYICWLPLIIYFLTFATKKYNNLTIYILMFVACCNAVIDPLVYAFRNREFCKALLLNFSIKK